MNPKRIPGRKRGWALSGFRASCDGGRQLRLEALERRELLAGDVLASQHNYHHPFDVNDDRKYSGSDALAIINHLSQQAAVGERISGDSAMFYDVNADHQVSSLDALEVMNALGRGEEVGELIELLLTARTLDDEPITPDADGDINVAVDEPFYLEVSYNELRLFNDRLGAFQLYTDIGFSEGNALEPILNETQRHLISEEIIQQPSNTTGTLTFELENSSTTYISEFLDFAQSPIQEFTNALTAFGYSEDQYELTSLDFGDDTVGMQIKYTDPIFGDVDLPDISIAASGFSPDVTTESIEFAPRNPDGSINSDAVRFNVNTYSRTFNGGQRFFNAQNRGEFDPVTGFMSLGGLGLVPPQGGGVPQLTNDGGFITPFDAFSLLVRLTRPVTDFQLDVNPGEDPEATLLYGRDQPIPQDMVLIDEDAVVTINATDSGQLDAPVAGDTSLSVTEDVDETLDLTPLLSGGAPTTIRIETNGQRGTARIVGNTLTYDPNLNQNGPDSVVYEVSNSSGSDTGTITIDITAENDAPTTDNELFEVDQGGTLTIEFAELLDGDSDIDGDTLTVTGVSQPNLSGAETSFNGAITYRAPATSGSDFFTYTLSDGTVSVQGRVDIIVGEVTPIASDGTITVSEDGSASLDLSALLSGGAIDTLTATDGALGRTTISGTSVTYTPDPGEFGSDTFTYTATNDAGSDTGQITVTINATSLPPLVSGPVIAEFNEDDPHSEVDLLGNIVDPDRGPFSVVGVSVIVDDVIGIQLSGSILFVDPGAHKSLVDNQSVSSVFVYHIQDDQGHSVAQQATITITGRNDPPRARNDTGTTVVNEQVTVNVLENDDAGVDEGAVGIRIIGAESIDGNARLEVAADGKSVVVIPAEDYFGATAFSYTIADADGLESTASATITIFDSNNGSSSASGSVFLDYLDSTRSRNGVQDPGEPGVGALSVNLFSAAAENASGRAIDVNALTNTLGEFRFAGLAQGRYIVTPMVGGDTLGESNKLIYVGDDSMTFEVTAAGQEISGLDFPVLGTSGNVMGAADLIASSFLETIAGIQATAGHRNGGIASIAADGRLNFVILKGGFDGIEFAEIVYSRHHDQALLTVMDENDELWTARLGGGDMLVHNGDGFGIQFFGAMESLHLLPFEHAISGEFPRAGQAIERALQQRD